MFKQTWSLSNAICNTHKIFLSECSWMTKKFSVTWSHNSSLCVALPKNVPWSAASWKRGDCTWPFNFPGAISYRCSIVTESLSPTIFEIISILDIWVTTLTFLGHVTSSVTWPFDSSGAISYRFSIVTESLSPTIFEIMGIFSYLGHDLDLSGSRDVIGHVIIWFPRCHFL